MQGEALKPLLDSAGTGKSVPIEYTNRENIEPYQSDREGAPAGEYTAEDYNDGKAATENTKVSIVKPSLINHVTGLLTDTDISSLPEDAEGAAGTLAGIALGYKPPAPLARIGKGASATAPAPFPMPANQLNPHLLYGL